MADKSVNLVTTPGVMSAVDSLYGNPRLSLRPTDHSIKGGALLGQYRAEALAATTTSGGVPATAAGGILASLQWGQQNRVFVLTHLAACMEVKSTITAAVPFDLQSFIYRGATGPSSGSGSTTISLAYPNQVDVATMTGSLVSEIRVAQGTVSLTAAPGKTNDGAPFGFACFGFLTPQSHAGATTSLTVGAASGWIDLFNYVPGLQHPIALAYGEGIEIQAFTANNTTGTVDYRFYFEWAEVAAY